MSRQRLGEHSGGERLVYGALAGVNSGACMTVLRMAAHRLGVVDRMPPQVLEEWLLTRTRVGRGPNDATHHLLDHVLHLAISGGFGLLYSALPSRHSPGVTGTLFGLSIWAVAFAALLPRLGATRHARNARAAENGVNIAAHALYGIVTGLLTAELASERRGITSDVARRRLRTG
jgi:hypothetical protein